MYRIRSGFLTLAATAGLLFWASIAVTPATASSVSFNFTGSLDQPPSFWLSFPGNSPAFTGMETVKGNITYDDTTPDSRPLDTSIGRYNNAVTSLSLNIGNGTYQATLGSTGIHYIQVTDSGSVNDAWAMRVPLAGPNVVGDPNAGWGPFEVVPLYLQFNMNHGFPSVFNSDALAPPTLSNLNQNPTFRVFFDSENFGQQQLVGTLSSITPVPLPPAVILFGAGLVALIGLGARNWQLKGNTVA